MWVATGEVGPSKQARSRYEVPAGNPSAPGYTRVPSLSRIRQVERIPSPIDLDFFFCHELSSFRKADIVAFELRSTVCPLKFRMCDKIDL